MGEIKIDKDMASRLKQLRIDNLKNKSLIKKACRNSNGNLGCCMQFGGDETICRACTPCDLDGKYTKLTQACLAEGLGLSIKTIERCEQKGEVSDLTIKVYKEFFGEELFNKYVSNDNLISNDIIVKGGISQPPCFLHRTFEIKTLFEKVKANTVTVVCGDGGVGKTTLVEQFLYEYRKELTYYQTITLKTDVQESSSFSVKNFLSSIDLTINGNNEYSAYISTVQYTNAEDDKLKWISDKLRELENGALFVLDNFSCIGNEIRELERNFPNCKFIITTRKIQEIRPEIVLNLETFNDVESCELFELYLGRANNPLSEQERDVFYTQINSWCCGNAEAIYYVAKMLVSSISTVTEYTEIEQWLNFYSGLEKDLTGEGNLAKKLASLLRLDAELITWINNDDGTYNNSIKLLAVLSVTKMCEISVKSIIGFLEEKKEFTQEIIRLESKGLLKINKNSQCVKMHPLICHALKLNGIEKIYTKAIKFYAGLLINDLQMIDETGMLNRESVSIPNGIQKLPNLLLYGCIAQTIKLPKTIEFIDWGAFMGCFELKEIEVSAENKNYASMDGNLYSKDGKELLHVCKTEETFLIPDSVEKIGKFAFGINPVKKIIISANVSDIDNKAFVKTGLKFEVVKTNKNYKVVDGNLCTVTGEVVHFFEEEEFVKNNNSIENEEVVKIDIVEVLLDENNSAPIYMYNQQGEMVAFNQVAVIPYGEDKLYCVLKPISKIPGVKDSDAVVFRVDEDDEGESRLQIEEDEKIANEIFRQYYELLAEKITEE